MNDIEEMIAILIGFYVVFYFLAVIFYKEKSELFDRWIKFFPPAFCALLLAILAYQKIDYWSEQAKINLIVEPCFESLEQGGGEKNCLDFVKEYKKYSDQYLKKYFSNQIQKIYSKAFDVALKVPLYRKIEEENKLVEETIDHLDVGNVYNQMNHVFWGTRAKACYLLLGVNQKLIDEYNNDKEHEIKMSLPKILTRLAALVHDEKQQFGVRIVAQVVYGQLTGTQYDILSSPKDPFCFERVYNNWQKTQSQ